MKCYNHHSADAVGVCNNCSKGVCPDCLTDVGGGIACTDKCVGVVRAKIRAQKRDIAGKWVAAVSMVVVGVVFAYHSYVQERQMALLMSIWIVVMGILAIVNLPKRNNGDC